MDKTACNSEFVDEQALSMNISSETHIKYESPYSAESMYDVSFQSPSLKRQRSIQSQDTADKQQRIDSGNTSVRSSDLAAFLVQATSCTSPQYVFPKTEAETLFGIGPTHYDDINCEHRDTLNHSLCMRILSIPMLESLATQIISILAQESYHNIIKIVTTPETEVGQAYATLKSLFDQTKKIYSQQGSFLSADALNLKEPEDRAVIRTSNLATFVCSVFGGHDVGFLELNDQFIKTFTVEGVPLQKEAGDLYLNLKTQIYLSAVSQEEQERTREDILDDLFPNDLDRLLQSRHLDQPLSQSEVEFISSYVARREFLGNAPIDLDSIQALSEKFSWEDFLKQVGIYLSKLSLLAPFMKRYGLNAPLRALVGNGPEHTFSSIEDDLGLQVELAAKQTLESLGLNQNPNAHERVGVIEDQYYSVNGPLNPDYNCTSIPEEQSAPTQVLYERARQAAVSKASPTNTRRPGLPSQRRPWSGEEERALMAGLDQVRGPHWSQILALYGARGTISEVLKDRNQVQLKDKARNLKLFFLKSGIEVPYYLKTVTGELKTRAPTQAAKREAEERARLAYMEDQIHAEKKKELTETICNQVSTLSPSTTQGKSNYTQDVLEILHTNTPEYPSEFSKFSENEKLAIDALKASTSLKQEGPKPSINMPSMVV
ncbi:Telomeric DNA-binding factor trf1 [Golovinomyces cichoracearum]|uniref:Telomeric DNA-binding factor trf1 n=1 Tax=Golovinomyces cichoracearum TaxID=62708 RepID=A0A420IF37_9PEZI|nr:Telomeric DNA-binding factor trf1 [Golovinomyces cichoracearum]